MINSSTHKISPMQEMTIYPVSILNVRSIIYAQVSRQRAMDLRQIKVPIVFRYVSYLDNSN